MREMENMKGHGLMHEGAAFRLVVDKTGQAEVRRVNWRGVGGVGRAYCACGHLSDYLPSGAARRRWHKEHLAEVAVTDTREETIA